MVTKPAETEQPLHKKRGVRWDGSDSKFSTLPIRGFAKDFFENFKEPLFVDPQVQLLEAEQNSFKK